MTLNVGDTAPDFTVSDQDGNSVTLSELRGKPVVLYFYPKADTQLSNCNNGGGSWL